MGGVVIVFDQSKSIIFMLEGLMDLNKSILADIGTGRIEVAYARVVASYKIMDDVKKGLEE